MLAKQKPNSHFYSSSSFLLIPFLLQCLHDDGPLLGIFVVEQVMEYHLQAIDELSIPDGSDVDDVDHLDVALPVTSKAVHGN